jgi:hypothetical protein
MASTQLDMTAANAALKEWYDDQKVQNLTYAKNPTLAIIPKDEDTGGKYYPVPVQYEVNQGRSSSFTNAQGNQTAALLAEFLVTRKPDYDIATIDNQTMMASSSDRGSFLRMATVLIDSAMRGCTLSQASGLFRSGTGSIGAISSISSGVITLTNPADVSQFGINQTLQANSSDGGTPRAALGYVIARSVRNGTITVASSGLGGSAGSPAGWTTNDFLLVQGDNNAKMSGFTGWLPLTDPSTSDSFYGVNRSVDYRLFGVSYDGSGQPIEEALIDHSLLLGREGASPDTFPTNFGSYAALVKALGTRREYEQMDGPAGIGFRAVVVDGATGPIRCFADRNCQPATGFMLQLDTWKLISLGPVPQILRYEDRAEMLRVYNSDAAEARIAAYSNLISNAPGWNGQTKLSA